MRFLLVLAAAAAAAAPNVDKLILQPAQVGKGYVLIPRPDGVGVKNTVTLNLCGSTGYPSERLRTARLQVDYAKRGGTFGLSNEVVAYRPGGAAQALREVARHAAHCPRRPVSSGVVGLPKLRFTITPVHDAKLLKGAVAVRVRAVGTVKGKRYDQVSYAVYQRVGDVLSGVYSFGPATPAQQRFVLRAAERSARDLRRGAATPSGPPA